MAAPDQGVSGSLGNRVPGWPTTFRKQLCNKRNKHLVNCGPSLPYLVRSQYLWEVQFSVNKIVPPQEECLHLNRKALPQKRWGRNVQSYKAEWCRLWERYLGPICGPRVLGSGCEKWGFRRGWEKCKSQMRGGWNMTALRRGNIVLVGGLYSKAFMSHLEAPLRCPKLWRENKDLLPPSQLFLLQEGESGSLCL